MEWSKAYMTVSCFLKSQHFLNFYDIPSLLATLLSLTTLHLLSHFTDEEN